MPQSSSDPFRDLPVLGSLPDDVIVAKLREAGDELAAAAAASSQEESVTSFDLIDRLLGRTPAWRHTGHAFGYIPEALAGDSSAIPLVHAGAIAADATLKGQCIKITLDRLRVADYPGSGIHRVLFDFYAKNQTDTGAEDLHFNATYRIQEGQSAGISGYPIFVGLTVGDQGVALRCFTINVKNDDDERFLQGLESDAFKSGLQLIKTAQPAIAPLTDMAVAVTRAVAQRTRNVPVQDFVVGLDFSAVATRARLACGSYVAVQIPESLSLAWTWDDWHYDVQRGRIARKMDGADIPYNYIVLGVSRV